MSRDASTVIREAKYLLSINEAAKRGPYGGYAAERFVKVMHELVEIVEKEVGP